MAEKIPEDFTIVRKHIRCVLRWFKAEIDYCPDCARFFIRGQQKPDGKEVIFVVLSNRRIFTGTEFFDLRKCLPVAENAAIALAIVDSLAVVTILSLNDGITKEISSRSWRPERRPVVTDPVTNPEPGPSRANKRGRKQVLTTNEELELRNIIVIDD